MMTFRVRYEVRGHMSFLSHLEMLRLWQRALIRGHLPIAWSQGFNPRPKLSLGPAKAVGIEGLGEYIDMEFKSYIEGEKVMAALNEVLPQEVRVLDLRELPPHTKLLEAVINEAVYRVDFSQEVPRDMEERIAAFMAKETIPYLRHSPKKDKELDLRSFVYEMKVEENALWFWVKLSPLGAVRPNEILDALGFGAVLGDLAVTRTGLFIREHHGHRQP